MSGFTKTTYLALIVLLVNEIEALFGSLGAIFGANGDKEYPVYWNVPTFMCRQYGMRFEEVSHEFGIVQNPSDDFRGKEIVILYDPGMFPALLKNATGPVVVRNGGVPQKGNLTAHLNLFNESVVQHISDDSFRGLAVIDFESWRPVYRQNWASLEPYRALSEKIVRQKHPEWDEKTRKKEATRQFEKWGRIFIEETLKTAKALRPRATWGYYAFPYCFNLTPGQTNEHCDPKVLKENDNMSWLFTAENVILPSVYLRSTLSMKDNLGLIRGRIIEALRMAKKSRPRKKVLAYFGYGYTDRRDIFLTRKELVNGALEMIDRGADGYIIWGSSFDLNTKSKCQKFRNYVNEILGPAVVEAKAMANQRINPDQRGPDSPIESNHENGISTDREKQLGPSAMHVP